MTRRVLPNTTGFALDSLTRRTRSIEGLIQKHTLIAVFDSGGVGLTTGIKLDVQLHRKYVIRSWTLLLDELVGSIQIDIWKNEYANYPPVNTDSITGGDEPAVVADRKATSSALTNWDTLLEPTDTLRYNIDSVTNVGRCSLMLELDEWGAAT